MENYLSFWMKQRNKHELVCTEFVALHQFLRFILKANKNKNVNQNAIEMSNYCLL